MSLKRHKLTARAKTKYVKPYFEKIIFQNSFEQ
jgi:hypothetical protein